MKVDLHVHTVNSDGNLTIDEVLSLAKKNKIEEISITDHDSIIALKNYIDTKSKYGISLIPGIEIPTNQHGMHILGYNISNFNFIEEVLLDLKKYNERCNVRTIDILRKDGINISYEKVKQLLNFRYLTYRDIVKYLYLKGYVNNPHDAYKMYIGEGTKAYVRSKELAKEEVISLINESGGFAVLAHPYTLGNINYEKEIKTLKSIGLSGIEINESKISKDLKEELLNLSRNYELLKTVGSDFHDNRKDKLGVEVSCEFLKEFHSKVYKRR